MSVIFNRKNYTRGCDFVKTNARVVTLVANCSEIFLCVCLQISTGYDAVLEVGKE